MKGNRVLCDCEMEGMCVNHLLCEEQRLLELYNRSTRSNKSKTLTLSYLCGLSNVYYNLDNHEQCIVYGIKAENLFAKLNLNNEQRVDNIINVTQSYLATRQFDKLEKFNLACDKLVATDHIPYKLLSNTMKERILYHKRDIQGYLTSLREQRKYCRELQWIKHREEELFYLEALTLYWLKCFIGAAEIMAELKVFKADQPLDTKHIELDALIQRALVDHRDIRKHAWNSHRVCYNCWKVDKGYNRCSGCNLVYFCSSQCQLLNWPSHKVTCSLRSQ